MYESIMWSKARHFFFRGRLFLANLYLKFDLFIGSFHSPSNLQIHIPQIKYTLMCPLHVKKKIIITYYMFFFMLKKKVTTSNLNLYFNVWPWKFYQKSPSPFLKLSITVGYGSHLSPQPLFFQCWTLPLEIKGMLKVTT